MPTIGLHNRTQNTSNQYLRIVSVPAKNAHSFLYIGDDQEVSELLLLSFRNGYIAQNIDEAEVLLQKLGNNIDVILIDTPFQPNKAREFQFFLDNRNLTAIPVLGSLRFQHNDAQLFDDVIDLENWQYDFSSKISFLKKMKEYKFCKKESEVTQLSSGPLLKRVFDIVASIFLLILLLPLFIIIAISIRVESKGPIFYNSKRAGRGFKIFKFHKFRTMEINADKKVDALAHLNQYFDQKAGAKFFKIPNDPRITKVGKFLRNTSLDELPQLFNVLKGDMSLVGNRPLPIYEASTLTTNEFVERFMAPAGMTGLWQIKKRGQSHMSSEERIGLDISYARKSSMLYDLWIMANTPRALLQKSDV